jgi:glycosyltransferase involved in cell wall biosynthesis
MAETAARKTIRALYRGLIGAATVAALPARARHGELAVYYGGARAGDHGGTLVKVRLLQTRYPEARVGFSLVYMLSNAIYLPQPVINTLRNAGIPVVLNQNGVFYPGWYPFDWQAENARMARVHAAADHVFYQSEFCRRCAEKFLGSRVGGSEILYNAVDTVHFAPRPENAPQRPTDAPFTFLATGKFDLAIGYRLMSSIEGIFAARRGGLEVRLKVAGGIDPTVRAQARRRIDELGLGEAVEFLGPYNGQQAPAIYQSADAYLMTKNNDPCPNSVLEAMSSGLPVLYSASGGVPELVGTEAGIGLAVPESFEEDVVPEPAAIAEGMSRIIRQQAAFGAAARLRAMERFDLSQWLARHDAVFEQVLRNAA